VLRALPSLIVAGLLGCSATRLPATHPDSNPARLLELRTGLFVPAAALKCEMRANLWSGGSEVDFSLVARTSGNELRLAGLTDLGGTLFQLRGSDGSFEVLQRAPFLDDEFLVETLACGLAPILQRANVAALELVHFASARPGLRGESGERELLLACSDAGAVEEYWVGREGRLTAHVQIETWTRGAAGAFPRRLTLVDGPGRTRVTIQVLSWTEVGGP